MCDRFVGPRHTCPFCGSPAGPPIAIRRLKFIAVLLAVGGLMCLYLMVRNREIPTVAICDITHEMNFAYVRVTGRVEDDAWIVRRQGMPIRVSFPVNDGTGVIAVYAYDSKARALAKDGRHLPARGDEVDVAGSISVKADSTRLYVEVPGHVAIMTRGESD